MKPRLFLLELNEANENLLRLAASTKKYPHIEKIIGLNNTRTFTEDTYDSGFLEPWAQWVSIHTGVPSSKHGIKHLGDVPDLKCKQIWEVLSENDVTSGIWGVMNGSRRNQTNCLFFLPDPWTAGEVAYPEEVNNFAFLAQYISRNYLKMEALPFIQAAWLYSISMLQKLSLSEMLDAANILAEGIIRFGPTKLVLGAFFEFTSACVFLNFKKQYQPRFSVLFLNLLAHAQHHYWTDENKLSAELSYSFKVIDMIFKLVQKQNTNNEILLIASGLSQMNTKNDEPWILYRQKDHSNFLKDIGIDCEYVDALMTHDALVYFKTKNDCEKAFAALSQATVNNKKLFFVEYNTQDPCKLFYRLDFTEKTSPDTIFNVSNNKYKFFDFFQEIVTRTGKHNQEGFVLQTRSIMPANIQNHELANHILQFFSVNPA